MGNKTNMKQIVIILMGVLLIVSMVGGVLSTLDFKIKYGATATCGNTVGICSESDNPDRPLTIKEIRENLFLIRKIVLKGNLVSYLMTLKMK